MTDWMDARRDAGCHWFNNAPGGTPSVLRNGNGDAPLSEWVRAAKFCQAVVDAMKAEAEEEEREVNLERKVFAALLSGDWHIDRVRTIIRTVREHDA